MIRTAVKIAVFSAYVGTMQGAITGSNVAAAGRPVLMGFVSPGAALSRKLSLAGAWNPTRGWVPAPDSPLDSTWKASNWHLISRPDRSVIPARAQPVPTRDESGVHYRLERGVLSGVALSGANRPQPRKARSQRPDRPELLASTREILASHGLTSASKPETSEAWRVDLNGDGTDEVLWVSRSRSAWKSPYAGMGNAGSKPGDFALLGLRYLEGGRVRSVALALETHRTQVAWHRVLAALDVNGDGRMEILAHAQYFEDDELQVYSFGKQGAVRVLPIPGRK